MRSRLYLALLLSMAIPAALSAQTKTSGTIQCAKADPMNMVDVGDMPGHMMMVGKVACTWTKPMEIGASATKDGVSVSTGEAHGMKSADNGTHWSTMADGDKIYVHFHGSTTMDKDGKPQTSSGHWKYTGGSGKLKGITGGGTYSGKANADGSMTYDITGDYKLPGK
jgi:hypothetical protein